MADRTDRQPESVSPPAAPPIRVAVVEPDPIIAELYVDAIKTGIRGVVADVCWFDDASPAAAAVLATADVCICSAGSNPDTMFDTLNRVLLARPEMPVVVLLAACAVTRLDRAVELGAADVLLRTHGYLDQIPATVRRIALHARGVGYADARHRALRESLDGIREENMTLASLIERLESLAMTDPLTGLLNRRALERAFARAFATSRRYGHELSCLVIDADGFKQINDSQGHAAGDELLKLIAGTIVSECRESDFAARLGGDEFVVLLPHTPVAAAAAVAERLRARFAREASNLCGDDSAPPSLTIGVASRASSQSSLPSELLNAADSALYSGKRAGRNRVVIAPGVASGQVIAPNKAA